MFIPIIPFMNGAFFSTTSSWICWDGKFPTFISNGVLPMAFFISLEISEDVSPLVKIEPSPLHTFGQE